MSRREESFAKKLRHLPQESLSYGHFEIIKTFKTVKENRSRAPSDSKLGLVDYNLGGSGPVDPPVCATGSSPVPLKTHRVGSIIINRKKIKGFGAGIRTPPPSSKACATGSSSIPLKTRGVGEKSTLNLSRAKTSSRWCGVVVRRGQLRCRPRHFTMVQNYEVRRQKFSSS
ncbi:hypothetical protein TNCV_2505201 [Trichonephila clavipes]|uniref:Uncharacterized protein n=1 Tax=Trichonephila clavipes TaxID=2585209 RepID=A0A8X7BKZ1_TRICX|nr:hypothetical protein TNCV_2505201 [Trichonephila clavipes]